MMPVPDRIIIAPFRDELLKRLAPYPIVIRLDHQRRIEPALDFAAQHHLSLHGLWVQTTTPLCAMDVRDRWSEAFIALFVPAAGTYREIEPEIPVLRQMRIRVVLPPTTLENFLAARILASFGVRSAIVLRPPISSWDALTDLMTHAIVARQHAAIEPFDYLAMHYRRDTQTDYSVVYFDDPRAYLHVDDTGRVALTAEDCLAQRFIAESVEAAPPAEHRPAVAPTGTCDRCAGWPVCLGRFVDEARRTDNCRRFFSDMLDVIEASRARFNASRRATGSWSPGRSETPERAPRTRRA